MLSKKYLIIVISLVVSACSSMKSTPSEMQSLKNDEGTIVGSILVSVAQVDETDKNWSLFKARPSADAEYRVVYRKNGLFNSPYVLTATPDKEEYFVTKLTAGEYVFLNISPQTGIIGTGITIPMSVPFTVEAGKAIYIGQLKITLPARLAAGASFKKEQLNKIAEAKQHLSSTYPDVSKNLVPSTLLAK